MNDRYSIIFKVVNASGQTMVNDKAISFESSDAFAYSHLARALVVMAKIIKRGCGLDLEVTDVDERG